MESSSKSGRSLFDWRVILGIAVIYSINALLLGSLDLGKLAEGHGEVRIFIFIPALGSLLFGPVSGALGAGFGNLLTDLIEDVILSGEMLDLGNLVGFVGNLVGAFVTGLFGRQIKITKEQSLFEKPLIIMYLQNILASVFGMAVITGEIIGIGLWLINSVPSFTIGISVGGSILASNGLFLLLTMLPIQIVMVVWQRRQQRLFHSNLIKYSTFTVKEAPENSPVKILKFQASEEGLVKDQWTTSKLELQNEADIPMRYRLEMISQDRFDPSVTYTKLLSPHEKDDVFFQILPFDDEERELGLTIRPWVDEARDLDTFKKINNQVKFGFGYHVLTSENDRLRLLTNFVVVLAFLAAAGQGLKAILNEVSPTSILPTILVLVLSVAELVFVLIYFKYRQRQILTHEMERHAPSSGDEITQRLELISSMKEEEEQQVSVTPQLAEPLPLFETVEPEAVSVQENPPELDEEVTLPDSVPIELPQEPVPEPSLPIEAPRPMEVPPPIETPHIEVDSPPLETPPINDEHIEAPTPPASDIAEDVEKATSKLAKLLELDSLEETPKEDEQDE